MLKGLPKELRIKPVYEMGNILSNSATTWINIEKRKSLHSNSWFWHLRKISRIGEEAGKCCKDLEKLFPLYL